MKKIKQHIQTIMITMLLISAIGMALLFLVLSVKRMQPLRCFYLGEEHWRQFYGLIAIQVNIPWAKLAMWVTVVIIFLYCIVLNIKESATKSWLCNYVNYIYGLVNVGYLYFVNWQTRSVTILTPVVCIILGILIVLCIYNKMSYKKEQLKKESSFSRAKEAMAVSALVVIVSILLTAGGVWNAIKKENHEAYVETIEIYYEKRLGLYNLIHVDMEPSLFNMYDVALVNMFNKSGETFTLEELYDSYVAFKTGEGSWNRFHEFLKVYYSCVDMDDTPVECRGLFGDFEDKVFRKAREKAEGSEIDYYYAYSMEELEAIMLETYYEMEEKFVAAGKTLPTY